MYLIRIILCGYCSILLLNITGYNVVAWDMKDYINDDMYKIVIGQPFFFKSIIYTFLFYIIYYIVFVALIKNQIRKVIKPMVLKLVDTANKKQDAIPAIQNILEFTYRKLFIISPPTQLLAKKDFEKDSVYNIAMQTVLGFFFIYLNLLITILFVFHLDGLTKIAILVLLIILIIILILSLPATIKYEELIKTTLIKESNKIYHESNRD